MALTSLTFTFGDTTGSLIGGAVFLVLSVGIGVGVFGAARRLFAMGSLDLEQPPSNIPIVLGIGMGIGVFVMFFQSSLSGFRSVELQEDRLTLHYDFPPQDFVYPAMHIIKIEKVPAFKGQWRLMMEDIEGAHYYSALARRHDVEQAWTVLHPLIEGAPSPELPTS